MSAEEGAGQAAPPDFYAKTYDLSVSDWPGELDFYLSLAREAPADGSTLELAAGTGRIAIRLAEAGIPVTALDSSAEMLAVGRAKAPGRPNPEWVAADMRNFDLGREFGLIIIPGHSFLNLLTADDQRACLEGARRHLLTSGRLAVHVDHQDIDWLGDLVAGRPLAGVYEAGEEFRHPTSGRRVRASRAWWYERSTQTMTVRTRWEEMDDDDLVVNVVESELARIHCAFRFEMEHLLAVGGFTVEAVYGDFNRAPLSDDSAEMIWLARPRDPA